MSEVGYATLAIIPSFQGFRSQLQRGAALDVASVGRTSGAQFGDQAGAVAGKRFGGKFASALKGGGVLAGIGAAIGIGGFIKESVQLEAEFGRTMAQIRVATGIPAPGLAKLDALAIKLGKDTIFSANEASSAMLELAKNGISPAVIQAGALKAALTLAAAGGVDLTTAATTMGNALNAFGLKGRQAASVAAALAGAANASSASVASLAEGLQQSATVANDVGFSVQETTGILAAFANAGISGSDAGTSLKTALASLIPSTNKARKAMERYGLSFVKRNGEFKGAVAIARELQDGLGDLSAADRAAALTAVFGSDARRAATILVKEGASGIRDYIKATTDQGAAEKMAKANMEGTAGSLARLSGAWDTAKLQMGKFIAPLATGLLTGLSGAIDGISRFAGAIKEKFGPAASAFAAFFVKEILPAIKTFVSGFAAGASEGFKNLQKALGDNKPFIDQLLKGFAAFAAFMAQTLLPIMGYFWRTVLPEIGAAIGRAITFTKLFSASLLMIAEFGARGFRGLLASALTTFDGIVSAAAAGLGWIPGIGDKVKAANRAFDDFRDSTITKLDAIAASARKLRLEITAPAILPVTVAYTNAANNNDRRLDGRRANGGPVNGGGAYLVGERGPEIFSPSSSGSITPNHQLGGGGIQVNHYGDIVAQDPRVYYQDAQRRKSRAAADGIRSRP